MTSLKIAIIGAGPAGSILAILLSQAGIDVTIFEGEVGANSRTQGGTLDLHNDTGLAALKRAGLYDEFLKHARFDGEALTAVDKHLTKYIAVGGTIKGKSRGRPEIDRSALRSILLDALPAHVTKWNHKLRSIDDDLTLHFDNGTESGFDLIVGAEGAWSKVRPLVTPIKPYFSGIAWVRLGISNAAEAHPDLYALVNRGSLFCMDDRKFLSSQQLGDGSLTVALFQTVKEDWMKDIDYDMKDLDAVKKVLLEELTGWDPLLRKLIEVSDQEPWSSNLYMLPVGIRWHNRPGVTLLGDAAHVMTPFAGEGVNLAMADAMRLADAIIKTQKSGSDKASLTVNVTAYEEDMFARATVTQQLTYDMMQAIFYKQSTIETWIITAAGHGLPWFLMPFFKAAVYAYFWYFRLRYG